MVFCSYFQARIQKEQTWLFVALLRSNEHLSFDRTINVDEGRFEFFVPKDNVERFLTLMHQFETEGLVSELVCLPNRLAQSGAVL